MAVYTGITDGELATLLARYDIGRAVQFEGITRGVENTNYRLTTDRGDYILTIYEKRVAREDLPFFTGLMEHLADGGIPAPHPVHDRTGKILQEVKGKPAAIITFLPGESETAPSPAQSRAAGEALARLHQAGGGFTMTRANALGPDDWHALHDKCRAGAAGEEAAGMVQTLRPLLTAITGDWPQNLPAGVIHADLFPDNVLFTGDRVTGVIDFYFACNDFLAYDLAITLNAWCFDGNNEFSPGISRAMIEGYQSIRKLAPGEVAAMPVLCRGAAMRFTLTRLYDSFNTPDDAQVEILDPREYLDRLVFHAAITDPAEYGFKK